MEVIDLMHERRINGILPKNIKIRDNIYHLADDYQFNNINFTYETSRGDYWLDNSTLDEEVEIIEEDKKIEFEDIELEFESGDSAFVVSQITRKIKMLIRNQKKLIEEIEKLKGKSE